MHLNKYFNKVSVSLNEDDLAIHLAPVLNSIFGWHIYLILTHPIRSFCTLIVYTILMNRLGIWKLGHKYLTLLADLIAKEVLVARRGNDASVWQDIAQELLRHNGHPKAIHHAAIDISTTYARGG